MQSLGYSDFTAAGAEEEKMTQFKRALKLTRPAFAATRSPMQQVPSCLPHSSVDARKTFVLEQTGAWIGPVKVVECRYALAALLACE